MVRRRSGIMPSGGPFEGIADPGYMVSDGRGNLPWKIDQQTNIKLYYNNVFWSLTTVILQLLILIPHCHCTHNSFHERFKIIWHLTTFRHRQVKSLEIHRLLRKKSTFSHFYLYIISTWYHVHFQGDITQGGWQYVLDAVLLCYYSPKVVSLRISRW